MRFPVVLVVVLIVVLALVSYTTTFDVRFTEAAVKTTFGSADESDVHSEPGLKFKLPYPIQSVTKYDTRTRFLGATSQTQQTADDRQIVVESYCLWRVSDPLKFFKRFSNAGERSIDHYKLAEDILKGYLRSAMAETSAFSLDELFTSSEEGSKLPALETNMLEAIRHGDETGTKLSDDGIEVVDVGIRRVVLPESTTSAVFKAMTAYRDRLATEISTQGDAVAQSIRSSAEADASRIQEFASRLAQEIRAKGDIEATSFIAQMNENPELATYIKELELLTNTFARQITVVMPGLPPGSNLLSPSALSGLKPNEIPRQSLTSKLFRGEPVLEQATDALQSVGDDR